MTEHPSVEQLADLAADALPADFAALVEGHVYECPLCSDLLAEAEGMGPLLRSHPDLAMPDEVWSRLAGALAAETAATPVAAPSLDAAPGTAALLESAPVDEEPWLTQTWPAVPAAGWTPQAPEPTAPPVTFDDAPTAQWQVFVDESDDEVDARPRRIRAAEAAAAETGPNAPADHVPRRGGTSRLGRPSLSVSRLRSRRDVREERRHASLERYGRPLGIAAGVVLALGLGGVAVKGLLGAGGTLTATSSSAAADSGAVAAGGAAPVGAIASGTNYTKATITTSALGLARSAAQFTAGGRSASPAAPAGSSAAAAVGSTAQSGTVSPTVPKAATKTLAGVPENAADLNDGSDLRLRDPAALQACLKELGVPDGTTPIMVDLAKFDGRDAAIIVLAGRDGGYEVWAVARDCRKDAGGQLSYTAVPAS